MYSFFKHFIDDVMSFRTAHEDATQNDTLLKEFEADMIKWHGLKWFVKNPQFSELETKLFENEMNLYLYFYLTSHPYSVFTGLISGQILYPLPFLEGDRDKR